MSWSEDQSKSSGPGDKPQSHKDVDSANDDNDDDDDDEEDEDDDVDEDGCRICNVQFKSRQVLMLCYDYYCCHLLAVV